MHGPLQRPLNKRLRVRQSAQSCPSPKSPASFKIRKIPQRRVTCYLDEFRRRTQLLRSTDRWAMRGPDGRMIPATNKTFEVEFCTVALEGRADHRGEAVLGPRRIAPTDRRDAEFKCGKGCLTHFSKNAA